MRGQALPRVNALVDLYNAISIRHVVPLGGEDADRLEGPLRVTLAAGRRAFRFRGDGIEAEPVPAGEVASNPVASAPAASAAPRPSADARLHRGVLLMRVAVVVLSSLVALPMAGIGRVALVLASGSEFSTSRPVAVIPGRYLAAYRSRRSGIQPGHGRVGVSSRRSARSNRTMAAPRLRACTEVRTPMVTARARCRSTTALCSLSGAAGAVPKMPKGPPERAFRVDRGDLI